MAEVWDYTEQLFFKLNVEKTSDEIEKYCKETKKEDGRKEKVEIMKKERRKKITARRTKKEKRQ